MANPAKVLATVTSVDQYGTGVYQVTFAVPPRYTKFLPGQFLHLTLDDFDPTTGYWPESRVFSIASQPRLDHVIIVYSVKGQYTQRMENELRPGKEVWLKLPYGDFVIGEELLAEGSLALIAGGTGVSPYRPFLTSQAPRQGAVHLFYGVRKIDHLLFRDELTELRREPWFHLHLMVEESPASSLAEAGRLSIDKVRTELGEGVHSAHYFLSGPPAMIRKFKEDLTTLGVAANRIHIDEWE